MATTVHLVRHAAHGLVGTVLCGRMPGVSLSEAGRVQAARLGARFAGQGVAAVLSSPQPRAAETAAPVALRCGLGAEVEEGLDEIDFGAWTGRSFASLQEDARWRRWNAQRDVERPPDGESMVEAQARALHALLQIAERYPETRVVAVSHGDVIKAVVAGVLGLSLVHHARFELLPASVSTIELWPGGARVLHLNEVVA